MKILKLQSENVKRLHAVEITPQGHVVEITGKNGMGKSSTLDSIFWALSGTANVQAQPIRKGAEKAMIRLDMGEIIVTRTFRQKDGEKFTTTLKVESADGASYSSGQTMLNGLLSSLTFDPLEFLRQKPKEQFDTLRSFVPGVDFEHIDALNKGDFERRSDFNKRVTEAKAQAAIVRVREDLPEDTTPAEPILDEIQGAAQFNQELVNEQERRRKVLETIESDLRTNRRRQIEVDELEHRLIAMRCEIEQTDARVKAQQAAHDELPPISEPKDVATLRQRLATVQALNKAITDNAEAIRRRSALEKVSTDAAFASDCLTAKINARNKAKNDATAAAQMPVPGIGFGDGHVTLNGVSFEQASSAEQLRTSIAIAMRKNSKLRVVLVRDGSLLDADSFKLLCEAAAENDMQVWVESVFPHSKAAIVIQDGAVAAADEQDTGVGYHGSLQSRGA